MPDSGEPKIAEIISQVSELRRWLNSYVKDVKRLRDVMLDDSPSDEARGILAGALNYQMKQLDLIPDWMPEVGMIDDVMVLRVAANIFMEEVNDLPAELEGKLSKLLNEADTVKEILQDLYPKFESMVRRLPDVKVHGRRAATIVKYDKEQEQFLKDLRADYRAYEPSSIKDPEGFHRQLLSYLHSKLD